MSKTRNESNRLELWLQLVTVPDVPSRSLTHITEVVRSALLQSQPLPDRDVHSDQTMFTKHESKMKQEWTKSDPIDGGMGGTLTEIADIRR